MKYILACSCKDYREIFEDATLAQTAAKEHTSLPGQHTILCTSQNNLYTELPVFSVSKGANG
jgi:hypothetical protein